MFFFFLTRPPVLDILHGIVQGKIWSALLAHRLACVLSARTQLSYKVLSRDALRMCLRRLRKRKRSGKCWVAEEIRAEYDKGGEAREILEMTLVEALRDLGEDDGNKHSKVKAIGTCISI